MKNTSDQCPKCATPLPSHAGASHCSWHVGCGHVVGLLQCQKHSVSAHSIEQTAVDGVHCTGAHSVSHSGQATFALPPAGQCVWHAGRAHVPGCASSHCTVQLGARHEGAQTASQTGSLHSHVQLGPTVAVACTVAMMQQRTSSGMCMSDSAFIP